jgi:pyridoxamine 5'-phosphate oxidase
MKKMKDKLRGLSVLKGKAPAFAIDDAPDDPIELFLLWFEIAIQKGVPEPHAMVLSTADKDGFPDARVLILKNVDTRGFHFAISSASRKGRHLEQRAEAALTFYWPTLVRQIRVRGHVIALGSEESAADFAARPLGSRVAALLGKQSDVLESDAKLDRALEDCQRRLTSQPDLVSSSWCLYAVQPEEIEFWQGASDRRHLRLRYKQEGEVFLRERLWP